MIRFYFNRTTPTTYYNKYTVWKLKKAFQIRNCVLSNT